MDIGELILWAIGIGFAINIFFSLTGLDGFFARRSHDDITKDELLNRIAALEARVTELEANS